MSAQPTDVAIGDTFERVGDVGGPWEVTAPGNRWHRWLCRCGDLRQFVTTARLLDPRRWRRVRAL